MSELTSSPNNSVEIAGRLYELGTGVVQDAVVIGSSALQVAFDGDFREPHDLDLAVSEACFRDLKSRFTWEESQFPDGQLRLQGNGLDIGIGWGGDQCDLQQRSWKNNDGLMIADLPTVYAWKQRRNSAQDQSDMATVRNRLQGPASKPLPSSIMLREVDFARHCLPEGLRDDPDAQVAIKLAANGLHIVRTIYGDITRDQVNHIIGELEKAEYAAPATYHEGGRHTPDGMRWIIEHLTAVNLADKEAERPLTFDKWHFLDGLVSYAYHDAIYGNGRQGNNPDRYDELQSARLAQSHAETTGYTKGNAPTRLFNGVHGTTFDQASGRQLGAVDDDPFIRAVAGVDLQNISDPLGTVQTLDLVVEDLTSERMSPDRILGRALEARDTRVFSTREALSFIDQYPDDKPLGDEQTIHEAFAASLNGKASFVEQLYKYPEGWTSENKIVRHAHGRQLRKLASEITTGKLSTLDAYEQAHQYAGALREQLGGQN